MPEWLVERGIGETRAALVESGEILEARIELEGAVTAGSIVAARLTSVGRSGRNAVARDDRGTEYLLPKGAFQATEGSVIKLEVTREAIPGSEPWKRPLARIVDEQVTRVPGPLEQRLGAVRLCLPAAKDVLGSTGWDDLIEEARAGIVSFPGGELRISPTPAMTLIDVDGFLAGEQLAVLGAREAARAIRKLDIGGSIGIDLPTTGSKEARRAAASVIDEMLPQPFERTAVNGFGFVQIVRPRPRPSLLELAQDRATFEARALLRRIAFEPPGPKRIVAHPSVITVLRLRRAWIEALVPQLGGAVELRADATVPMSGGYAETL